MSLLIAMCSPVAYAALPGGIDDAAIRGAALASFPEYQELLSEVIGECASLERLVNQLLLLAETDSELIRAHSEQVDLSGRCSCIGICHSHGV